MTSDDDLCLMMPVFVTVLVIKWQINFHAAERPRNICIPFRWYDDFASYAKNLSVGNGSKLVRSSV